MLRTMEPKYPVEAPRIGRWIQVMSSQHREIISSRHRSHLSFILSLPHSSTSSPCLRLERLIDWYASWRLRIKPMSSERSLLPSSTSWEQKTKKKNHPDQLLYIYIIYYIYNRSSLYSSLRKIFYGFYIFIQHLDRPGPILILSIRLFIFIIFIIIVSNRFLLLCHSSFIELDTICRRWMVTLTWYGYAQTRSVFFVKRLLPFRGHGLVIVSSSINLLYLFILLLRI